MSRWAGGRASACTWSVEGDRIGKSRSRAAEVEVKVKVEVKVEVRR
jgi:hypothetical protein